MPTDNRDTGGNDWNLADFSKALETAASQRDIARQEWMKQLGHPAVFIPDEDPELAAKGFGLGLWKTSYGVYTCRRYANGYHPEYGATYHSEFIDLLIKVRG